MGESVLAYGVLLAYLILLAMSVITNSTEKRISCLFIGFIFVPSCVSFWEHPSISVRDTMLYAFFFGEIVHDRYRLREAWKEFPVKLPFLLVFTSYFITGFLAAQDGLGKTAYEVVRGFFDVFSFLFVGFYAGREIKGECLLKSFGVPIIAFCLLGFAEAMLQDSFAFRYVCKAFPIYKGAYWLNGTIDLAESWRTRIIITMDHPNALAGILVSLYFFFFAYVDKKAVKIRKLYLILALLGVSSILCGSRTLVFLLIVVSCLFFFMRLSKIAKMVVSLALAFSLVLGVQVYEKFMETFNQEGQGSSIELRYVQLAVSYTYFMNSPIYGNGLHFIQKDILGNDDGSARGDDDAKYFESLLFVLLINFGIIGLASYMVLIIALLIYFLKRNRRFLAANQGFLVTVALFAIMFLNGNSGNYFNFGLMLVGLCMGNCTLAEKETGKNVIEQKSVSA